MMRPKEIERLTLRLMAARLSALVVEYHDSESEETTEILDRLREILDDALIPALASTARHRHDGTGPRKEKAPG